MGSHTLKWPVGVVFIATNQIVAVEKALVIRAWSWSTVGGFVLMWHRTVRCHTRQSVAPPTAALTSAAVLFIRQSRPLRADSCCFAGTPDSPVNYSGGAPGKPEGEEFELVHPGAPDTVRWHTGLSGAPDQGTLWFPFCSLLLTPTCSFDWFMLNLWHL